MENNFIERSDFFRSLLALHFNTLINEYQPTEDQLRNILYTLDDTRNLSLIYINYDMPNDFFTHFTTKNKIIIGFNSKTFILRKDLTNTLEFVQDLTEFSQIIKITPETKNKALITTYEQIKKEIITENSTRIKQNIDTIPNYTITKYDTLISEQRNYINSYLNRINEALQKIRDFEGKKITSLLNPNNEYLNKFFNFINKCNYIKAYNVDTSSYVTLITTLLPVSYTYAEQQVEKYITSIFTNENTINILKNALTTRDKYIIYTLPLTITIKLKENLDYSIDEVYYDIFYKLDKLPDNSKIYWQCFNNKHWADYRCLGDFRIGLNEAKNEYNPLKIIMLLLQYLQTLNIADLAGTKWINSKQHLIFDVENNCYLTLNTQTGVTHNVPDYYLNINTPNTYITRGE